MQTLRSVCTYNAYANATRVNGVRKVWQQKRKRKRGMQTATSDHSRMRVVNNAL